MRTQHPETLTRGAVLLACLVAATATPVEAVLVHASVGGRPGQVKIVETDEVPRVLGSGFVLQLERPFAVWAFAQKPGENEFAVFFLQSPTKPIPGTSPVTALVDSVSGRQRKVFPTREFVGLAYTADGRLFGLGLCVGSGSQLYEVDTIRGTQTLRAGPARPSQCSSSDMVAYNPADGMLYALGFSAQGPYLDQIDPTSFAVTRVLEGPPLRDIRPSGLAFSWNGKGVVVSNSRLYDLDLVTGISQYGRDLFDSDSCGVAPLPVGAISPVVAGCVPTTRGPCLGQRFRIEVDFTPSGGTPQPAGILLESPDSIKFWFFNKANVELIVKVLDGCAVNGSHWVFAGGLTNVAVTIRVTDTMTGAVKTYTNPQGTAFLPVQDTSAFPGCL